MIELENFHRAAQAARGDAHIVLSADKTGVTTRSGRIARWIGKFRRSGNHDTTSRFVELLRERYGRDVVDHLVESTRMGQAMGRGKPLRARQITAIVGEADALRAAIVNRNAAVATSYSDTMAIGLNRSILQNSLELQSRKLFPTNPNLHLLVDSGRLSGMVDSKINAAGNNGKNFVTTEKAARILTNVVNWELQAAYETAQQGALNKLSFEDQKSISRQAFAAVIGGREQALNIDPNRVEADLVDALHSKFEHAVASRLQASEIDDEPALRALAGELMEDFAEERAAVRDAVEGLAIDTAAKEKMLDQALHDNIRADMIPALGRAYLQVRDDLSELGEPLGAAELQGPLSRICDSMTSAIKESEVEATVSNQDAIFRSAWRLLLAPGGKAQASAIAGRMEHPGSALRKIGQGATWFRSEFPQTEEGSRSVVDESGREQLKYARSIATASRYSVTMENLARVLRDKTDAAPESFGLSAKEDRLSPQENQSDEAVAMLRNVGIAMPAPDRVGQVNPKAPVSQPSLDRIREEVDAHVAYTAKKRVENGLLAESTRDFDRATYRVNGQDLTRNADAVAEGLRVFCTNGSGRLNEEMLLGISKVAYQAIPLSAFASLFHPGSPETSLFEGSPGFVSGANNLAYDLSRNDNDEVILNVSMLGPLDRLTHVRDDGGLDAEPLDPGRSQLYLTMELKLDANDFKPTVEAVNVGYSLFRGRDVPRK